MKWLLATLLLAGVIFPPIAFGQFPIEPHSFGGGSARIGKSFALPGPTVSPVKPGGFSSGLRSFSRAAKPGWEQLGPRGGWGRRNTGRPSHARGLFLHNLNNLNNVNSGLLFSSPYYYPFTLPYNYYAPLYYPSLWPPLDEEYLQARQIAQGDVAGEVASQQNDLLTRQIQALSHEVESLRQESASQPAEVPQPSVTPPPAVQTKSVPTVFVYRDGRSLEARNYAIFGRTLWVFGDETTRRIPLSALNLPATLKLNEEHGIDVALPKAQ